MPRTVVVRYDRSSLAQGTHGVLERSLVAPGDVETHFDVRYIELPGGGTATAHAHDWEQATYVLSGECHVTADEEEIMLKAGDFIFFESGVHHGFVNSSETETLMLLAVRGPH